mgnify:CR=1 FL=1
MTIGGIVMSEGKAYHFETLQLHVGQEQPDPSTGARAVPIYMSTSYVFKDSAQASDRFALKDAGFIYSRLGDPTSDVLEKRLAALEGGVGALVTATGAAAISYTIQALCHKDDHIVAATTIYGGTYNLFAHTLPDFGIETTFVDPTKGSSVFEGAIRENTQLLYIETVGNPNANLIDIGAVAEIAHKHGIPLVVDNTFATPYLVRPFEFGADIETFRVDSNYYVVNFTVPEKFIGYNVNELKLDSEFGLKLLALKRAETLKNCLGISFTEHDVVNELPDDDRIQAGDRLVCYGRYRDFQKFWKAL